MIPRHSNSLKVEKLIPIKLIFDTANVSRSLNDFCRFTCKDIHTVSKFALETGFKSSIETAMKYTPPAIGRKIIPSGFYKRKVEKLADIIQRGNYTKLDALQFNKGMKFKIYVKSEASISKSKKAYAYCKTSGEAKKLRVIANRGLTRVMWGKSLEGEFQYVRTLLQKSPALAKYNFNYIRRQDGEKMQLSTRNGATKSSNITPIAMRNGIKTFNKVFDKTFNMNRDYISKWKSNLASKLKKD